MSIPRESVEIIKNLFSPNKIIVSNSYPITSDRFPTDKSQAFLNILNRMGAESLIVPLLIEGRSVPYRVAPPTDPRVSISPTVYADFSVIPKEEKQPPNIYLAKNSIFLESILSVLISADFTSYLLNGYIAPILDTLDLGASEGAEQLIDDLHKVYNRIEYMLEVVAEAYSLDFCGPLFSDEQVYGLNSFPRYFNTNKNPGLCSKLITRLDSLTDTPESCFFWDNLKKINDLINNISNKISNNFYLPAKEGLMEAITRAETGSSPDIDNLYKALARYIHVARAYALNESLRATYAIAEDLGRLYNCNRYRKINLFSSRNCKIERMGTYARALFAIAMYEGRAPQDPAGDIKNIVDKYRKYGILSDIQAAAEFRRSREKTASPSLLRFTKALSLDIPLDDTSAPAIQPSIRKILKDVAQNVSTMAGVPNNGAPEEVVLKALRVSDLQDEIMLEVVSGLEKCLALAGYSEE